MPLALRVPYNEKDQAKKLCASWNTDHKIWTVPDHVKDIDPFKKWIPAISGYLVRKPYLLCLSQTKCWKCGSKTPTIALAARN